MSPESLAGNRINLHYVDDVAALAAAYDLLARIAQRGKSPVTAPPATEPAAVTAPPTAPTVSIETESGEDRDTA